MAAAPEEITIEREPFGVMPYGEPVERYRIGNGEISLGVTPFGARITDLWAADRNGVRAQVVLGMETFPEYLQDESFQGAVAGRYANRIAHGRFTLDGKKYQVPANNGDNALHGGPHGFSQRLWTAQEIPGGLALQLTSDDGDQGFPGSLQLRVRYTLEGATLNIDYDAVCDRDTVLNVTNHSYFNLRGEGSGNILDHVLQIPGETFTPTDAMQIPTGELRPVQGTPFDFRRPTPVGARVDADDEQLRQALGYDHNWVLGESGVRKLAAVVHEPHTGRTLTVHTTEPGVQFYSGNFLNGALRGVMGALYERRTGFCLETQHFPDSPNHADFPSTVLRAHSAWQSSTSYNFSVKENPWQS